MPLRSRPVRQISANGMPGVPALDASELRALAGSLVTESLIVFPIRHHSPACAWHLRELIRSRPPRAILVEGPSCFTPLIPLIVDERAQAPFAVYTYCVERAESSIPCAAGGTEEKDRRHAAYYPFCDYSPELVAFREGARLSIPMRFIDLEYAARCRLEPPASPDALPSLMDEHHLRHSLFLERLAEQNGCRSHDELWDHWFEAAYRSMDTMELVARIAAYCEAARRDIPLDELERDGTNAREREMAWHIGEALGRGAVEDGPVLAVTGGFHAVRLPPRVVAGGPRPRVEAGGIKDRHSALIRYSFERLDRLNGYASGMPSPAWYQAAWEQSTASKGGRTHSDGIILREAALNMLLQVAERIRKTASHDNAPTADVIAAYEHALRLAQLRSRPGPTREDVLDAVRSCLVKGSVDAEGALVLDRTRQVFVGIAVGGVPPQTGAPPLVRDFEIRARRFRLKIDDSLPHRVRLDLYGRPEHRLASRFLHGMELLRIPFAVRGAGPDFVAGKGLERLHEHWQYQYSPATDAVLMEAAVYGTTVPEAVATRFQELLGTLDREGKGRSASTTVDFLVLACVLGLHERLAPLLERLEICLVEDPDFPSLCRAITQLLLLWESREPLDAAGLGEVPALMGTAYRRACFLIPDLTACPENAQDEVLDSLKSLHELLHGTRGEQLDGTLFRNALGLLLGREPVPPLLVGGIHGLLFHGGCIGAEEILRRARGELDGREHPQKAVAYLRGLLHMAREVCWQMPRLLGVLDDRLTAWDDEQFLRVLPELRLAFSGMTPRETDRIAAVAAEKHGALSLGALVHYELMPEELNANLALNQAVRGVLASDGLDDWLETSP